MAISRNLTVLMATSLVLLLAGSRVQATPYSSLVLSKSPVSYWRLGEASGATAFDETGANDGTYVNSPALGQPGLITGDPDTAVGFNGTNQIMNAGNNASLHFGGAITVTAWINADALPTTVAAIVSQWDNIIAQDRFLMGILDDGRLSIAVGNGSNAILASTVGTAAVTPGARHFLAFSFVDGTPGTTTLFFDGEVDPITSNQSPQVNNINTTSSVNFHVGGQVTGGGRFFDGIIDEVAVFDRALSAAEIQELFVTGTTFIPEPSTGSILLVGLAGWLGVRRRRRTV